MSSFSSTLPTTANPSYHSAGVSSLPGLIGGYRLRFDVAPSASGPGRYVASLCSVLAEGPANVDYPAGACTPAGGAGLHTESSVEGEERNSGRRLRRTWSPNRIVRGLAPSAVKTCLGAAASARRQSRASELESVDLYHAQNTGCEESPIAARLAGVPIVLGTFHTDSTYDLFGERSGIAHRMIEWVSNRCLHHAIAVSEATKQDWVRRTRIAEDKVTTIHNGVCPDKYRRRIPHHDAKQRLGLSSDSVVIGAVGRLDHAKGHADLIDAYAACAGKHPSSLLAIAGTGPLREALQQQATRLGLQDRVVFLGHCDDVHLVYDALDVYAMPSLCEALPFALLEAMAHELPAVTSRAGGMPEVVVEGETGLLVDVRDSRGLSRALDTLLSDAELRVRFGKAGRERVERRFTEERMVRETLKVYEMLIERRLRS